MDTGQLSDAASTSGGEADGPGGADRSSQPVTTRRDQLRLAFASFLMLFVELALIR
jgi:hypothetical protein